MANKPKTAEKTKRPRYAASVTYEMCRELIDQGMDVTKSFTVVGDRTGRTAQAVHSAYYAHSRRLNVDAHTRNASGVKSKASNAHRGVETHIRAIEDHAIAQEELINELKDKIKLLEREVKSLRTKAAKFDAMIAAGRQASISH